MEVGVGVCVARGRGGVVRGGRVGRPGEEVGGCVWACGASALEEMFVLAEWACERGGCEKEWKGCEKHGNECGLKYRLLSWRNVA